MADDKKIGIDTGTPGFDIDGKSYTFDLVEKDAQGIEPVETNHGDINVNSDVKDISKKTLETLGSYLGKSTSKNSYSIDESITVVPITTNNGVPPPLGDTQNSDKFIDRDSINNNSHLSVDPREEIVGKISKGKADPQLVSGHTLLPNVSKPESEAKKYVSAVLKNNRFTASEQSSATNIRDPNSKYDPTLRHPKFGDVSMSRLAQVGPSLSIRASTELNSADSGNNPTDGGTEAGALLPGFGQLGVKKVKTRVLEAYDILNDLTSKSVPDSSFIEIGDESWGSLNNVHDQFSGFQALGMLGLSAALTAATVVTFEGLSVVIGLMNPAPPQTHASNGRYILGNAYLEKSSNIPGLPSGGGIGATLLGIRPTVKPLSEALKKGVEIFFGFEGSSTLGAVGNSLKQSVATPGFNVIVARNIIRSSTVIIEAFKKAFSSSNLVSGIKNVLNIVETIKKSKFIAAVNVFAQLGDAELTDNEDEVIKGLTGEPMKKSRIDSIPDDVPGFAVMKHRFNEGKLKLTWASNTTPSLYLLPSKILGMSLATKLGGFQTGYGLQESRSRSKYKLLEGVNVNSKANRIEQTGDVNFDVESVEKALEAEYVPFYFHDIRTNEIISFHAFISSLNESYAPGYESSEGFGRTDAIMIYKNTKRSINFKFHIVSTSLDDFNDMWVKINKLTTLVYPQYTQGRLVSTENYEFVQPFSQMMGASPMIRLRLGDLIKSNYSRFALARLFGAGTSETLKLNKNIVDFKISADQFNAIVETLKTEGQTKWLVSATGISADSTSLGLPTFGVLGGSSAGFASSFNPNADSVYLPVTIQKFVDSDSVVVTPSIISPEDLKLHYGLDDNSIQKLIERLKMTYENGSIKNKVVGGKYVIPRSALRMSPMLAKSYADKLSTVINEDNLKSLHDFMNSENNALVKSFESVKGKGLAGFITSMDFDWMDKVTWETIPGSKAPKMCTVTMTYAPIHDISPGLDHTGYNRSPIYPVGWFNHAPDDNKK